MSKNEELRGEQTAIKNSNKVTGNSINEHRNIESANIILGKKEIGQQNENL